MINKTVTIITVIKNNKIGFAETLKSTEILRENFNISQIVVDSSNENIKEEIKNLSINSKNVYYFWQPPLGISSAFNFGLKFVKSEWVWFLNSGDIINPDVNIDSFLYILDHSYADAVIYQLKFKQSEKILQHPELWSLWPPILSWIPHPTTILKKKLFDIYGLFDENLKIAMDYELWLRFFSKNVKVDIISIPLVIFDQTGLAIAENKKTKKEVEKIIKRYFWIIIKKWFWQLRMIAKALLINSVFFRNKTYKF